MSTRPELAAKAVRIEFVTTQIFPQNAALSAAILRLMMATDDLRHLMKLLTEAGEGVDKANEVESLVLNGELLHLFRLACGHLYEARQAFNNLQSEDKDFLDIAMANDEKGEAALKFLREAYVDTPKKENILYLVRQGIGFHYPQDRIRDTYAKYAPTEELELGSIIQCEVHGLGRYVLADNIAALIFVEALNTNVERLRETFKETQEWVIRLAGNLAIVVDRALQHCFEKNPSAIRKEHECTITVPQRVQQAKDIVQKERDEKQAGKGEQP